MVAHPSELGPALLRPCHRVRFARYRGGFGSPSNGLRIVSELVGRAYGVPSTEAMTKGGYVGAKIVDDGFVGWFHWPLSGA
jgi:hypothetical protein